MIRFLPLKKPTAGSKCDNLSLSKQTVSVSITGITGITGAKAKNRLPI
ncbi:MAG: hypothetical protein ACXWTS_00500 [Methylococcaceae bacterium]